MKFNNEISRSHSGNVYTHKATEFNMEARESYQRMYHPSERLHMHLIISSALERFYCMKLYLTIQLQINMESSEIISSIGFTF